LDLIKSHRELKVYQKAFVAAMEIFQITKNYPKEELYSLTDQIRRSSRSVAAYIAEAFRRRKYPKSFSSKLSESEAESAETQNWLDFSLKCGYIDYRVHENIDKEYGDIINMLIAMQRQPEKWSI